LTAVPLALVGVVGALHGPRYDVIIASSGDLAAVRDADGALEVVGKRFNAFAAEQWLAADGDGRDPALSRSPDPSWDRLGCVADLPEGESLSIVLDRLAFGEDCARAEVVVSALAAPRDCKAKFVLDEQALARLGAVGLTWSDDNGFTLASDRSPLENRPWSPTPKPARDDRVIRPGNGGSRGADPADAAAEPDDGR
jgi:competence protein ComEC